MSEPVSDERLDRLVRHIFTVSVRDEDGDAADEVVVALRELLARREADAWQDIATAPKDGTPILATNGRQQAAVYWWPMVWMGTTHNGMQTPTHWRPLPAAPGAAT